MESEEAELRVLEAKAWDAIARLNAQYSQLDAQEKGLREEHERMQREEECLRRALEEAHTSGVEHLEQKRQDRQDQIVARLEDALMNPDDSSASESDDGNAAAPVVDMMTVSSFQTSASSKASDSKHSQER